MKKTACAILMLLMFVSILTGCGDTALSYRTYVTDISNGMDFASTERVIWPHNRFDEAEAPREYIAEFQGNLYTGQYKQTSQEHLCSFSSREYSSDHGEFKIRTDTGSLAYISLAGKDYYDTEPLLEDVADPEATAIAIADQVVSGFAQPSDYERTVSTIDISKKDNGVVYPCTIYAILYTKYKCGIPTQDIFFVAVSSKGNFRSIVIGETGVFDDLSTDSIDLADISKSVDTRVRELYSENSKYTYIRHEIRDKTLCYTPDHELAVVSNVIIYMRNDAGSEMTTLVEMTTLINEVARG